MSGSRLSPWKGEPSRALLALHQAARERGEDPFVTEVLTVGTPGPPPQPLYIAPADWGQIAREEAAAERAAAV